VAQHTSDESIFATIRKLVHEEQRIVRALNCQTMIKSASSKSKLNWTNAGTCFGSATRIVSSVRIPIAQKSDPRLW
jgi:hypothetical protein